MVLDKPINRRTQKKREAIDAHWKALGEQYGVPTHVIAEVRNISKLMPPKDILEGLARGTLSPAEAVRQHLDSLSLSAIDRATRRKKQSAAKFKRDAAAAKVDAPRKKSPAADPAGAWSKSVGDPDFLTAQRKYLRDNGLD